MTVSEYDPALAPHTNMAENLTAPFARGAVQSEVELRPDATATAPAGRQSVLLVSLREALDADSLVVEVTVDGEARRPLRFAPFSEAAATLLAYRPASVGDAAATEAFEVAVKVTRVAPSGAETEIDAASLSGVVGLVLLEGVLARMLFAMGAEKQTLRRASREIARMRSLGVARDDALDRMGAETGVPRFSDEIITVAGSVTTLSGRESDVDYRRRLRIYTPMLLPSKPALERALNGPGKPDTANAGALGELGLTPRFTVVEDDNPFAVAIHLIATGDGAARDAFLKFVRDVYLVEPLAQVPGERFLHSERRAAEDALRERLNVFPWAPGMGIAPVLARVLDRAGRCLSVLAPTETLDVLRTQDGAGGSRYELGLGMDVSQPNAILLRDMATALASIDLGTVEPEVRGLLAAMTPRPPVEDPAGAWFFEPCGFRTVHSLGGGRVYLSHLPSFGLAITGANVTAGAPVALEARYHAPGDPGKDAVLIAGLPAALEQFTASGGPAWNEMDDVHGLDHVDSMQPLPAGAAALRVLQDAGLPAFRDPGPARLRLKSLSPELFQVLEVDAAMAGRIIAGDASAAAELRGLMNTLAAQGIASGLVFVDPDGSVLVVAGVTGLPEAGLNLADRRSTGFRWYSVPLQGPAGAITPAGSRATFTPAGAGLVAIVCIAYSRRGATDPFEFRVELPEGEVLDIRQYEFLMNLLDHVHPAGVEVNTFDLRRRHVDLDGDGQPDPLTPSVSRTYRRFRRERHRGEAAVTLDES